MVTSDEGEGQVVYVGPQQGEAFEVVTAVAGDVVAVDDADGVWEALDGKVACLVDARTDADERLSLLATVRERTPDLPVLFVTESPELAADALDAGATEASVWHENGDDESLLRQRLVATLDEATGQRREQRLAAQRAATDQLLDAIDDIFYLIDADGSLQRWNAAMNRVTGYSDDELAEMHALDFFPADHEQRVAEAIEEVLATGSATVEAEMVTADGDRVSVEYTGATVVGDDGQVRGIVGIGRDITARNERERELTLAETVFEETQDALFVVDVADDGEFRVLRVNSAYEDETGMDASSLRGKTPTDVVGEEHGQEVAARYRECVDRAAPIEYEEELPIDGETQVWHTKLAPVVDDGAVTRLVGATRNITARKEREEELAYRTALLEAISETTVDGLLVVDDDGEVVYHNEQFREMWNIPAEVAASRNDEELLAAVEDLLVDPEAYREKVQYLYDNPAEESHETIQLADGRWFDRYSAPVVDDGDHLGRLWMFRDVTERKQREQELKLKTRAMDEAPIGIAFLDATADGAPLSYVNDGFVQVTGYSPADARGETIDLLTGAETEESQLAKIRRALDDRRGASTVLLLYRKDGRGFWAQVSLAPVTDESGTVTNFVGFVQDVTEMKEYEQEIERRLDEFGDILAEDLRRPLRNAAAALDTADNGGGVDVEAAAQSVERVGKLLDDLTAVHSFELKSRDTFETMPHDGGNE